MTLYATASRWIEDVSIVAAPSGDGTGRLNYTVSLSQLAAGLSVRVSVLLGAAETIHYADELASTGLQRLDGEATKPTSGQVDVPATVNSGETTIAAGGELRVPEISPWEPGAPNLYTLRVDLIEGSDLVDRYDETFGFRSVAVRDGSFFLNGKPFYFKGFGRHEDADFSGRGHNPVVMAKDFSLMKWIGANSFRTSHYPYAEEVMRMADREGFVVIDEAPAVGLELGMMQLFGVGGPKPATWEELSCSDAHRQALEEMIARDKNHPCVVMWSVANEPASQEDGAREYFEPLVDLARIRDPESRPVTIVQHLAARPDTTRIAGLCDVITLNRYYGWYVQAGHLETISGYLGTELEAWWKLEGKPVLMTEYGADTLHGLSATVPTMWTEEFQEAFLQAYHRVFDAAPFFAGEHVWNFADFQTAEGLIRVDGNKKGVFTRNRKPKRAARLLRERWRSIPDFGYK